MKPYFSTPLTTLYNGDCRTVMKTMSPASVNCVVTSPPYFNLRDYDCDGQIGKESTVQGYIAELIAVFEEAYRVLRNDGVAFINIADGYARNPSKGDKVYGKGTTKINKGNSILPFGFKEKQMFLVPQRLAIALQDNGWFIRNQIIWYKPNPTPESAKDRCTRTYEVILLCAKSEKYYFNQDAIAEQSKTDDLRVCRDVWTINVRKPTIIKGRHFAAFPDELAQRCILAGCPERGTILDPFAGSGTTLSVAQINNRRAIGIELNPNYCDIAVDRCRQLSIFEAV